MRKLTIFLLSIIIPLKVFSSAGFEEIDPDSEAFLAMSSRDHMQAFFYFHRNPVEAKKALGFGPKQYAHLAAALRDEAFYNSPMLKHQASQYFGELVSGSDPRYAFSELLALQAYEDKNYEDVIFFNHLFMEAFRARRIEALLEVAESYFYLGQIEEAQAHFVEAFSKAHANDIFLIPRVNHVNLIMMLAFLRDEQFQEHLVSIMPLVMALLPRIETDHEDDIYKPETRTVRRARERAEAKAEKKGKKVSRVRALDREGVGRAVRRDYERKLRKKSDKIISILDEFDLDGFVSRLGTFGIKSDDIVALSQEIRALNVVVMGTQIVDDMPLIEFRNNINRMRDLYLKLHSMNGQKQRLLRDAKMALALAAMQNQPTYIPFLGSAGETVNYKKEVMTKLAEMRTKVKTTGIADPDIADGSGGEGSAGALEDEEEPIINIFTLSKEAKLIMDGLQLSYFPAELHDITGKKLWIMAATRNTSEIAAVLGHGAELKQLDGSDAGTWQFRINDTYRIRFEIAESGQYINVRFGDFH